MILRRISTRGRYEFSWHGHSPVNNKNMYPTLPSPLVTVPVIGRVGYPSGLRIQRPTVGHVRECIFMFLRHEYTSVNSKKLLDFYSR